MTQESFVEVLRQRIRDTEREIEDWSKKEEEANRQKRELSVHLQEFHTTLNVYMNLTGQRQPSPTGSIPLESARFLQMTIPEAVITVLKERGGRAKTAFLADELIKFGKLTSTRHTSYSMIHSTMKRLEARKQVKRVGAGEWMLVGTNGHNQT